MSIFRKHPMILTRLILCVVVMLSIVSLFGCNNKIIKIGQNRYQISVSGLKADAAFTKKAQQQCPNGYKVIERTTTYDMSIPGLSGTIACD